MVYTYSVPSSGPQALSARTMPPSTPRPATAPSHPIPPAPRPSTARLLAVRQTSLPCVWNAAMAAARCV